MVRAEEIHVVAPGLCVWSAYDPAVKCDLWSTGLLTEQGFVFIDPIAVAEEELADAIGGSRAGAIVLTNGNHARAVAEFRQRFGIPIWAPQGAVESLEIPVDRAFAAGDALPGGLGAIALPAAGPGEVALLWNGVLCFGDAVINFGSAGFSLLPAKYCADARELPNELRKLLSYETRILTFAHGAPIVHDARERLHTLLA
jgi:hypothetical protein